MSNDENNITTGLGMLSEAATQFTKESEVVREFKEHKLQTQHL